MGSTQAWLWPGRQGKELQSCLQPMAGCPELLETSPGLGRHEKSKLPQSCRHKRSKRAGGTAVCEALVSSDLGGCMLKVIPWHLHYARSILGILAAFRASRRMETL